jgi:hypothetical protein
MQWRDRGERQRKRDGKKDTEGRGREVETLERDRAERQKTKDRGGHTQR